VLLSNPNRATGNRAVGLFVFKRYLWPVVLVCAGWQGAAAADESKPALTPPAFAAGQVEKSDHLQRADFMQERASNDARKMANWIVASGDNQQLPFAVIDKVDARVYVFHSDGALRGAAAVLLGLAVGDDSVPGIGERTLSSIRPDERTTAAGRFVSSLGRDTQGGQILWVDYASALSLHPVITSNAKEHRAQRLATPTPLDNRISYGCINVPADFFKSVVKPAFTHSNGIVYILPETRPLRDVFPALAIKDTP
jgi:hypothetical protein